ARPRRPRGLALARPGPRLPRIRGGRNRSVSPRGSRRRPPGGDPRSTGRSRRRARPVRGSDLRLRGQRRGARAPGAARPRGAGVRPRPEAVRPAPGNDPERGEPSVADQVPSVRLLRWVSPARAVPPPGDLSRRGDAPRHAPAPAVPLLLARAGRLRRHSRARHPSATVGAVPAAAAGTVVAGVRCFAHREPDEPHYEAYL